ncbi:MAG: DUF1934 domain-containing protein [Caulobacteraceae bacterium]
MENGRNIKVHIQSSQSDSQGTIDSMEFYTEGKYYEKEGNRYITYKESEISGMEGTTSTLRISGATVTLIRLGNVNSKLVFEKGRETRTSYQTGYGNIDLTIASEKVDIEICNNELSSIYLKYILKLNSQDSFINEMTIRVVKHW